MGSGFDAIQNVILGMADWLCWGVIVYAGANWMLGNRNTALQHLMGAAFGFELVIHAAQIVKWLKGL